MPPPVRWRQGRTLGRSIAQPLADGYQPAMMVMAALYAVATIITGLWDGGTVASWLAPRHDAMAAPRRSLHQRRQPDREES